MRKMMLVWLFLAALSGGVLYHTSQQVTDGRQRLATIDDNIRKEDETIRVLQAEWSYLNQPERLEKLSRQYLTVAPLKGKQFAKLPDIALQPVAAPAAPVPAVPTPVAEAEPVVATPAPVAEAPAALAVIPAAEAPKTAAVAPLLKPTPKAEIKIAAKPPVVKWRRPATPPKSAPPVATAQSAQDRSFTDVMKSLGVH